MWGKQYRRTTVIAVGLTFFLVGLVMARKFRVGNPAIILGSCIVLAPLLFHKNMLSLLSISIIGLLLGCWRGTIFMQKLVPYSSLTRRLVTIQAIATSDAVYGDKTQLEFEVGEVRMVRPSFQKLIGTISVSGFGESMIYRGDMVQVTAKLYPTRGSKQASLGFAKITRLHTSTSRLYAIRRSFSAGLQSVLPQPLGSFGLGILIGQRTTLPQALNDDLSKVGLTHIVAVSGYNLTIMVQLAHRLARKRSKYQATFLTLCFILVFIAITGSSASIIRAAIVSGLSLWSWYYGRTFQPMVLILVAAALTAGWFPPYIWSDLGWHLSFLAFFGVLVVAPQIQAQFFSNKKPKILLQLFLETTSAQIMTLPLIMYIFGNLSLIAVLANMMIVWLIPLAMAVSFGAGLAGMLLPRVAGWLTWPATITMTYMLDIVKLLAGLPYASVGSKISAWQLVASYGIILGVIAMWWRKRLQNDRIKVLKTAELQ